MRTARTVPVDNLGPTVGFSYGIPAAGAGHHSAVVRHAFKQEKRFTDALIQVK